MKDRPVPERWESGCRWTARQMREELWAIFKASGADVGWADARHLNPGEALSAVRELARDYDAALKEIPNSRGKQ